MLRSLLLGIALIALLAGCGSNVVGPAPSESAPAFKGEAPNQVPPTKAENYMKGEPDDVELGPRG